jgi:hypothetical protein
MRRQQRIDLVEPSGGDQSELRRIAADRVAQLGALANQPVAQADQHLRRLPLGRLDRNKAHPRPAHRFADRLRIGAVVLVARHIGLDQLRRQQHRLVAQRRNGAPPVMRRAAGFDADPGRLELRQKIDHVPPPKLLAQNRHLPLVHPMQNKNTLGRVDTNSDNLAHGRLLLSEIFNDLILAQRCRRGPSTPTVTPVPSMLLMLCPTRNPVVTGSPGQAGR